MSKARKPKAQGPGRGGRREGAGRPPISKTPMLPDGISVMLTNEHVAKVERWQDEHDCSSFSEALRQMIDAAAP